MKRTITIKCYGKEETWTDRKKAIAHYAEGMMYSDGSEQARYCKIYSELMAGLWYCSDEWE